VSHANEILNLMRSALCDGKGEGSRASWLSVAYVFWWQVEMIDRRNVIGTECRLLMRRTSEMIDRRNVHLTLD
jgi:hypothetical protein